MKRILGLILMLAFFSSCAESYKVIEPNTFNEQIANRSDIETPEDLIRVYYDYPEEEGVPNLNIKSKKLNKNNFEVTLIHEGLMDDSQAGIKIVLKAKKTEQTWTVSEIKENWKCWEGRGHTDWGTELCH
ncbi:MAG TPA: hypothetical protein VLZ83_04445 [Edaphocola sp.]|nr:hypothetical protein [Edaphocola sp.]